VFAAHGRTCSSLFRDGVQLGLRLVDLVVCVHRHVGGRHRFALLRGRFVDLIAEDVAPTQARAPLPARVHEKKSPGANPPGGCQLMRVPESGGPPVDPWTGPWTDPPSVDRRLRPRHVRVARVAQVWQKIVGPRLCRMSGQ
jgi:hypothetical protein